MRKSNATRYRGSVVEMFGADDEAQKIEVEIVSEGTFRVRVIEGKSETSHTVTLKPADYERIAGGKIEPRRTCEDGV